jgi:hypothetical protein
MEASRQSCVSMMAGVLKLVESLHHLSRETTWLDVGAWLGVTTGFSWRKDIGTGGGSARGCVGSCCYR